MSQEVQISASLIAFKNGVPIGCQLSAAIDMSASEPMSEVQIITTAATAITFGGITGTPRKLMLVNLDQTNYLQIDSANTFDKFPQKCFPGANGLPGDPILLSPQTATIYGKANTASCRLLVIAVPA